MKKTCLLLTLLIISFFSQLSYSYSQLGNMRFAAGLTTIDILGENLSTLPIWFYNQDGDVRLGGGFSQTQSGFKLEGIFPIDAEERFEIPVAMEVVFFSSHHKNSYLEQDTTFKDTIVYDVYRQYTTHSKIVSFITLGINYNMFIFDLFKAKAKVYSGIDSRLAFIGSGYRSVEMEPSDADHQKESLPSKSSIRLGANFSLGLNGELNDKVNVDLKCGVGIINLVGKDNSTGDIFTYDDSFNPLKENYVWSFNLAMMLQYRF